MTDFGKREIFVNLAGKESANKKLSIYIGCLLFSISIGFFIVEEARWLLAFMFFIIFIGLVGLWIGYFKTAKIYQNKPYLVLNETGLIINHANNSISILWREIKNIDVNLHTIVNDNRPRYHIIQNLNDEIFELNDDLIADKLTETIVLLKRYAEHYGTAKFIY